MGCGSVKMVKETTQQKVYLDMSQFDTQNIFKNRDYQNGHELLLSGNGDLGSNQREIVNQLQNNYREETKLNNQQPNALDAKLVPIKLSFNKQYSDSEDNNVEIIGGSEVPSIIQLIKSQLPAQQLSLFEQLSHGDFVLRTRVVLKHFSDTRNVSQALIQRLVNQNSKNGYMFQADFHAIAAIIKLMRDNQERIDGMLNKIGNKRVDFGRRSIKIAPLAADLKLAAQSITLPTINHDIQEEAQQIIIQIVDGQRVFDEQNNYNQLIIPLKERIGALKIKTLQLNQTLNQPVKLMLLKKQHNYRREIDNIFTESKIDELDSKYVEIQGDINEYKQKIYEKYCTSQKSQVSTESPEQLGRNISNLSVEIGNVPFQSSFLIDNPYNLIKDITESAVLPRTAIYTQDNNQVDQKINVLPPGSEQDQKKNVIENEITQQNISTQDLAQIPLLYQYNDIKPYLKYDADCTKTLFFLINDGSDEISLKNMQLFIQLINDIQ